MNCLHCGCEAGDQLFLCEDCAKLLNMPEGLVRPELPEDVPGAKKNLKTVKKLQKQEIEKLSKEQKKDVRAKLVHRDAAGFGIIVFVCALIIYALAAFLIFRKVGSVGLDKCLLRMGRVALVTSVLAVWSFTISFFPNFLGIVLGGLFSVPEVLLFLQAFPEKQPSWPWMIVLFLLALAIPVIALLGALKVRRRIKNYNKLSQPGGELRAIRTEEAIIDALEDFTLKPPVPEREDTFYPENEESEFDREYRKEQLEKIEAEAEDDRAEAFYDIDYD